MAHETETLCAQTLTHLLLVRGGGKTICLSEVARALDHTHWRELMPIVYALVWKMEHGGRVVVTQKGQRIGRDDVRGPIQIGPARNI